MAGNGFRQIQVLLVSAAVAMAVPDVPDGRRLRGASPTLTRHPGNTTRVEQDPDLEIIAAQSFGEAEAYRGAVFFGHMNPDADAIGSAFAGAELYGGIPACPMERNKCPNAESKWIMDQFNVSTAEVPLLNEIADLVQRNIVLVDFNDVPKGPSPHFPAGAIPPLAGQNGLWLSPPVLGAIDHHALSLPGLKTTDEPELLYGNLSGFIVETHAWGSGCSIMAHKFMAQSRLPSKKAAGLMLGGILSDTLGLTGPTTTKYDVAAVGFLSPIAGINDTDAFFEKSALAKSSSALTDPLHEVFDSDLKTYDVGTVRLIIGTVEVANADIYEALLAKRPSEISASLAWVLEKHADSTQDARTSMLFITVVNIKDKESTWIVPTGGSELCVAQHALSKADPTAPVLPDDKECRPHISEARSMQDQVYFIDGGSCVSRKSQFQPTLVASLRSFSAGELEC